MSDKLSVFIGLYSAPAFGHWAQVDGDADPDDLHARAKKIVARFNREYPEDGPAEEYAVFDVDGAWAVPPGESADFEYVVWLAALTEAVGSDAEPFGAWVEHVGQRDALYDGKRRMDVDEILEAFRDKYRGTYASVEEYAEELIGSAYEIDKLLGDLAVYFDYAAFGRDLELGGDIWTHDVTGGEVAIFDNH